MTLSPDLGERHSAVARSADPSLSSSSEFSPASAQNLEPPTAQLSGSGDRGEDGSLDGAAPAGFVAAESPARGRDRAQRSFLPGSQILHQSSGVEHSDTSSILWSRA
jgi:hypothetical protein